MREARRLAVERAEVTLIHNDLFPLARVPVIPDPLIRFARALREVNVDSGESATVAVDLLPFTPAQRRRHRRRLARRAASAGDGYGDGRLTKLWEVTRGLLQGRDDRATQDAFERIGEDDMIFAIQVLIKVATFDPERTRQVVSSLVGCFDQWTGANAFERHGWSLFGLRFVNSAEVSLLRPLFDFRLDTGLFFPLRRRVVLDGEIAPWLKPPFETAETDWDMVRLAGAETPKELEPWDREPNAVPLGYTYFRTGPKMSSVPLADTRLTLTAGRSKSGKSNLVAHEFLHLARTGRGCMLLDYRAHNLDRIRPYLTDQADRVVEINLDGATDTVPAWNIFAGHRPGTLEFRANSIMAAFSSVLMWGSATDQGNAAGIRGLLRAAIQSLLQVSLIAPPELAPTIFQLPTFIIDYRWREATFPYLTPTIQQYWRESWPTPEALLNLSLEVGGRIFALLEELKNWPTAAALLGSPYASYSAQHAMDKGQIVLICPGAVSESSRLVANLLVFDLLYAARARGRRAARDRQRFFAFIDELEQYDGTSDSRDFGMLIKEAQDYGLVLNLLCAAPAELKPETLKAVMNHRSRLVTGGLDVPSAELIQREWRTTVDSELWISLLERHHFLVSAQLDRRVTTLPFQVAAPSLPMVWSDVNDPDGVPDLEERSRRNGGNQQVADTLSEMVDHGERLREWLLKHASTLGSLHS